MLGILSHRLFPLRTFSEGIFPTVQFPKGIFPTVQFPKGISPTVQFPKRQLSKFVLVVALGPYPVLTSALGPYPVITSALGLHYSLRCLRRPNLTFGKLHIWKVATWEVTLSKMKKKPNTYPECIE